MGLAKGEGKWSLTAVTSAPHASRGLDGENVQVRNVELWLQFTLVSSASCRGPLLCHEAAFLGRTSPVRQDTSDEERVQDGRRSGLCQREGLVEARRAPASTPRG